MKANRPADYTSAAALQRTMGPDVQPSSLFSRDIGDWDYFFENLAVQGEAEDEGLLKGSWPKFALYLLQSPESGPMPMTFKRIRKAMQRFHRVYLN